MAFRLIKTSALSSIPDGYALDGRDYAHMSVGVPIGTAQGLSSVKVEVNQLTEAVYSNKSNFAWLSSANPTGKRMITEGVVAIAKNSDHLKALSAAASVETLTVAGNISANGGLSAASTATGTQSYFAHNVGIGTTGPEYPLHAYGAIDYLGKFESSDSGAYIVFEDPGSTTNGNRIGISSDKMKIFTGNNHDVTINDGNVGIGTDSPGERLTVNKNTGNSLLSFETNDTPKAYIGVSNDADGVISGTTAGDLSVRVASNDMFFSMDDGSTTHAVIKADGKFGIGTPSPDYTLDVAGSVGVDDYIRHNGDANTYILFNTDEIRLGTAGADVITIDSDNEVGIGVTDPDEKLEVNGNIKTSGNVILDDGGSITEGGGSPAITIDSIGHITKLGQDNPTTGEFLKWDGSKIVWDNDTSIVFNAPYFVSDVATGTAPYQCTSTTLNTNLNADLWDDKQFGDYLNQGVRTQDTPQFVDTFLYGTVGATHEAYLNLGQSGLINGTGIRYRDGYIQVKHHDTVDPGSAPGWGTVLNHGYAALCWATIKLSGVTVQGLARGCNVTRFATGAFQLTPGRVMSGNPCVITQRGGFPNNATTPNPGGQIHKNVGSFNANLGVIADRTDYVLLYTYEWYLHGSWDTTGSLFDHVDSLVLQTTYKYTDVQYKWYAVVFDSILNAKQTGVDI